MDTAKVFWSGRSQAVRLPKSFRFPTAEVRIRRHGEAVILEPVSQDWSWLEALTGPVDADFETAAVEKPGEQHRPELDILQVRYLLDTNAVIGLLRGDSRLLARMRRHAPQDFGLPAVVAHELFYGAFRSSRQAENLARIEALRFEVLPFDKEDARQAASLRATLGASGTPIGPFDTLIAGQARERNLTLVSHNVGEFSRVSGLRVVDWEG